MNRALFVILTAVTLDAIGIGLIMPILPSLLRQMTGSSDIAGAYGWLIAVYALMQFLCAPILGVLSDRFGRRPVLLVSLVAAAIDYVFMAWAPSLALLFIGRVIAGIAGANMAVASAYITDITPAEDRGRRFGWMQACFGLGFIAGPVLGGWLSQYSLRDPFWLAAALNGLNFLLAWFVLPESHRATGQPIDRHALNPFAPLKFALRLPALVPLLSVFVVVSMVGQIGGVVWMIYGSDRYDWDAATLGWSLAAFGLLHAVAQGMLTGPAIRWLGERGTFLLSIAIDAVAYTLLGLASEGWMAFAVIPLLCIGGLEGPSLQALLTRQTDDERQGELQGLLTSLGSLAGLISTVVVTTIYAATATAMPGLVWFLGAALYLLCIGPLVRAGRRGRQTPPAESAT